MPPPRIYADFNGLSGERGKGWSVPLDTMGTLKDLANAGVRLSNGLQLVVFDQSDEVEDLEANATAHFDSVRGVWAAEIGVEGYRYVPTRGQEEARAFLCVACRTPLDPFIQSVGLQIGDLCPSCATPIHAPLIPPEGLAALRPRGLAHAKPRCVAEADWIVELIGRYLAAAEALSRRLSDAYQQADLLSGRRAEAIPRTGTSSNGIEFSFHGIGCWMADRTVAVDVDFTPDGGVDGFDAWRLHRFSEENPSLSAPRSQKEVQVALEGLLQRGAIRAVDGSRLFKTTGALPR